MSKPNIFLGTSRNLGAEYFSNVVYYCRMTILRGYVGKHSFDIECVLVQQNDREHATS